MKNRKHSKHLLWLCKTAMFAALLLMLQLTGLGLIVTPWGLKFTLYGIVVVVGTLAIDLKAGLLLASLFGGISAWQNVVHPSDALLLLKDWSIGAVIVLCILPRVLIPFVTWGVRRLLLRTKLNDHLALAINGFIGSMTNTVLFLGMMLFLYVLMGTLPDWLLGYIGTTVAVNGCAEAALTTIATPAIVLALSKLK